MTPAEAAAALIETQPLTDAEVAAVSVLLSLPASQNGGERE